MLKSIALQVTGNTRLVCESCERRVQRLLRALPGVREVRARVRDQRIDVVFDTTRVDVEAIAARLAEDGYQMTLAVGSGNRCDTSGATAKVARVMTSTRMHRLGWLGGATSVLASAAGLICPACFPAVAGLLASLGIGVAAAETFLRPALVVLLMLAVAAFGWSAARHKQWWVVATGLVGGVLVYLGRYYFGFPKLWMNQAALWTGAGMLVGTSVLNFWLKRRCMRCADAPESPIATGDGPAHAPASDP